MKTIHWQLPFASLKGIRYRIDIYAEGAPEGGVKTLTGGASPFTTDEDNSDDFFSPVRSQTGHLNVIDTDGTLMEKLMPENNTDRPLRLVNDATGAVMWQGFISCNAYSQSYTARTQEVTLNVNSVLAAMESVDLESGVSSQFKTAQEAIADVLTAMNDKAGVKLFERLYFPKSGISILWKYFNMSTFFDKQMQCNEDTITYVVKGISTKEMLERICQFMGWTLMEHGRNLIFCAPDDKLGMRWVLYDSFKIGAQIGSFSGANYTAMHMRSLSWMGDGHTKSITQGAKSVEVVANLSDFVLDIELPECPVGNLEEYHKTFLRKDGTFGETNSWYMLANTNDRSYSNLTFRYYRATVNIDAGTFGYLSNSSLSQVLQHMAIGDSPSLDGYVDASVGRQTYAGAFLCREELIHSEDERAVHNVNSGLHCVLFPGLVNGVTSVSNLRPVATLNSVTGNVQKEGYLKLTANISSFVMLWSGVFRADTDLHKNLTAEFGFVIRFGDKYWNESQKKWQTSFSWFKVKVDGHSLKKNWNEEMTIEETDGYLIPINEVLYGDVEVGIMPIIGNVYGSETSGGMVRPVPAEVTFSTIAIDFVQNTNNRRIERKENHYYRALNANFSDEKFIDFQLGSDLNNLPSPSTPMEDVETPITSLPFLDKNGNEVIKRPEIDLLDRACAYYEKARRCVDLVVEHPDGADLSEIRFEGFDGKTYVALSESRDWQQDSSTIRCFEIPE